MRSNQRRCNVPADYNFCTANSLKFFEESLIYGLHLRSYLINFNCLIGIFLLLLQIHWPHSKCQMGAQRLGNGTQRVRWPCPSKISMHTFMLMFLLGLSLCERQSQQIFFSSPLTFWGFQKWFRKDSQILIWFRWMLRINLIFLIYI